MGAVERSVLEEPTGAPDKKSSSSTPGHFLDPLLAPYVEG